MNRFLSSALIGSILWFSALWGGDPDSGAVRGQNAPGTNPENAYQGKTVDKWTADLEAAQTNSVVQNRTRWYAAYALGQMGRQADSASDALIHRLNEIGEYEYVRSNCAWALGRIQNVQAIPALTNNLSSKLASVRKECAAALGNFGSDAKSALPALEKLLSERTDSETAAAPENTSDSLSRPEPSDDSEELVADSPAPVTNDATDSKAVNQEREPAERARAAAAIWKIAGDGSPEAEKGKQTLNQMLRSNSGRNRLAVLAELKQLPENFNLTDYYKSLSFLVEKSNNDDVARESGQLLATRGQLDFVEPLLKNDDSRARVRGLRVLDYASEKPPVETILPLLSDAPPAVRAWAVRVLSKTIDNPDAETAILKAVDDESPDVKRAARKALKK